jgi:ferredoxin-type protein NapH
VFGNFFCGWICPFGTVQDYIAKLSSLFIKKKFKMPYALQKYLQFSRYIIFILFIIFIGNQLVKMPYDSYKTFLAILGGREIEVLSMIFFAGFLVISIFFDRPFCNYVCSEAVRYGVTSLTRVFSIKRDNAKCFNCKKCDQACPMNIKVSRVNHVRSGQCVNCFSCIGSCPVDKTLSYGFVNVFRIIKDKISRNKK